MEEQWWESRIWREGWDWSGEVVEKPEKQSEESQEESKNASDESYSEYPRVGSDESFIEEH